MKRIILYFVFLSITISTQAQQLPLYSQYMMNSFLLNPAVAGHDGFTAFNFTAREQWMGFPNAPRTVALSGTSRLLKNSFISRGRNVRRKRTAMSRSGNVGIGGYIYNDRNGMINRTGFQGTYAYHIWMGQSQLSFGVSLTAFQLRVDESELLLYDDNDPLLNGTKNAMFVPDFNLGVYYHSKNFYVGLSSAQMLQSALKFGNDGYKDFRMDRHYYLMSGYGIYLENDVIIEPSLLFQSTFKSGYQLDLNTKVYYKEDYWVGLSYRTSGSLIGMGGVKVDRYYFGYAFDYTFSSIRKHSFGSHEFMASVKFGDSARRYRWLNRY